MTSLHAVANVPMFALHGIGRGIVGGPLLSTDELSRTTAQVALRVLAGESPGSIRAPAQRTGLPIRERLKLVNGDCVIVSRPGEGTRVEGWVPLRPDA